MTVLTTFVLNSSAADSRDTLNQMLADIAALKTADGGSTTPPASNVLYDQTTADTGYRDLGASGGTIEFVLNDTDSRVYILSDTDGKPGIYVKSLGGSNGRFTGFYNSTTVNDEVMSGDWNYQDAGAPFSATPAKIVLTAKAVSLFIGDMNTPKKTDTVSRLSGFAGGSFTNVRFQTDGAAVPVKITKA